MASAVRRPNCQCQDANHHVRILGDLLKDRVPFAAGPLISLFLFKRQRNLANRLPITKKATKAIYPKKLRYYPNANKNQYRSLNDNYDERLKYVKQIERTLSARKLTPAASSPEMAHHNFFGFHRQAIQLGRKGEHAIHRALDIAKNYLNELRPTKTLEELMSR